MQAMEIGRLYVFPKDINVSRVSSKTGRSIPWSGRGYADEQACQAVFRLTFVLML
jgi:hypothetical protein